MMNSRLGKVLTGAGLGFAGWKLLDSQFQVASDLELLYRLAKCVGPIEKAPNEYQVVDMWQANVDAHPDKPCIIFTEDGSVMTFKQVDDMANKVANWARGPGGFSTGDVVALFMQNRPAFIWLLIGLSKAGLVVALINSNNKQKPLLHSIDVAFCKALVFGTEISEAVAEVKQELLDKNVQLFSVDDSTGSRIDGVPGLEELLEIAPSTEAAPSYRQGRDKKSPFGFIYTSGTTGLPKACVITNYKFMSMSTAGKLFQVTSDDRVYTCLPLYHSSGLGLGFGNCVNQGATLVLARKFSATKFMRDCTEFDVTAIQYIGELCRYLLNSPPSNWDTKHKIRIAIGNGLRREIWQQWQERFQIPEVGEFYGSTEGNVAFGNHSRGVLDGDLSSVGSVGKYGLLLRRLMGFKIVKHDVENEAPVRDPSTGFCIECADEEPGELLGKIDPSRASSAFVGYTSKEATEKKILRDVFEKGDSYFRTGDLMRRDSTGQVYFVDRIGDTFRWKAENVSTGEVSEIVSVYPGIQEANVYGVKVPGNEDGRACMVAMVLDDESSFDYDAFSKHVHKNLASYAVPLFLRILEGEMDLTGTFKHRKVDLVKDGLDLAVVKDKMLYLDTETKKYLALDGPALAQIASGKARL